MNARVEALVDALIYTATHECYFNSSTDKIETGDCTAHKRAALLAFIANKDAECDEWATKAMNRKLTIDTLTAELADAVRARDSAYERAASLCEGIGVWKECAAAIRALSCVVVPDSARTCQRGTKGCERNHL